MALYFYLFEFKKKNKERTLSAKIFLIHSILDPFLAFCLTMGYSSDLIGCKLRIIGGWLSINLLQEGRAADLTSHGSINKAIYVYLIDELLNFLLLFSFNSNEGESDSSFKFLKAKFTNRYYYLNLFIHDILCKMKHSWIENKIITWEGSRLKG